MGADPSKVEAVIRMERPTDVTGVQRIMGTVGSLAKGPAEIIRGFTTSQTAHQEGNRILMGRDP